MSIFLTWKDILYTISYKNPKGKGPKLCRKTVKRDILRGVSGIVSSGECLAIIGASGAGKTSLLNILSQKVKNSSTVSLRGEIMLNGKPFSHSQFNELSSFVTQDDHLLPALTVRETLMFAANLKLKLPYNERVERVDEVLKLFKLSDCQNTMIGNSLIKGISGGERKRTSIAMEMINKPKILVLDEPTSGLDSYTAFLVVSSLIRYAQMGNIVMFTIHQPSSDIFNTFDRLLLLVDGKLIFQGQAKDSMEYFNSFGFPVPHQTNPTDFYMDLMYNPTKESNKATQINQMIEHYNKHLSEKFRPENIPEGELPKEMHNYKANIFKQLYYLVGRTRKNFVRIKGNVVGRIMANIIIGSLYMLLYGRISSDFSQLTTYTNRMGALYSIVLGQMVSSVTSTLASFSLERAVFLKEYRAQTYSIFPYVGSKLIIEVVFIAIVTVIFCTVLYWVLGFYGTFLAWLYFTIITVMLTISGNAFGTMVACLIQDPKLANTVAILMIIPFMVFSGFYVNNSTLPVWLRWVQYLSPMKYALEALLLNEFGKRDDDNLVDEYNPIVTLDLKIDIGWDILALAAFYIFCLLIALSALKITSMRKTIQ